MTEVGDNLKFSTVWTKNCVRADLDEVKRLSGRAYPSLGISQVDDIELLEALRVYKAYLIRRNKREGY
jgi:hypothetical protein